MNPIHLQLFIRIANTNNISQAGDELGLSAAVASSSIAKLEKELGARLLHRTTRHVSLSEDGKAFLPFAESILENIEAAKSTIGTGYIDPVGTLRITAPASFGRQHLLPAISEFLKQYQKISIDLSFSDGIVNLAEGGFDVAIRNAKLKESNLIAKKLASDKRIVCASPEYLNHYGVPTQLDDLKNHYAVILQTFETWYFQNGNKIEAVKPKSRMKTDNGEVMRDACCAGVGITINSIWNTYKQLINGELIEVLQNYPLATEDTAIWALYPYTNQTSPRIKIFIDFLVNWFGETPYWELELLESCRNKL